jgi:hypothetical protein
MIVGVVQSLELQQIIKRAIGYANKNCTLS